MQFALNYSPQAAALLHSGKIEVDRFKCPDWPHLVAAASPLRPTYVHFPFMVGDGSLARTDWAAVDALLSRSETAFINAHVGPSLNDFPQPDGGRDATDRIREAVSADVRLLVGRYGAQRVILENVPYQGSRDSYNFAPLAVDPAFLRGVIRETGAGFLLDVSHARLSAWALEIDERAYIAALPVEYLRELHVTGIQPVNGRLCDHMPFTDRDWDVATWALERVHCGDWARPDVVTFEYGGVGPRVDWRSDASVIETQVPRLYDLVHGLRV